MILMKSIEAMRKSDRIIEIAGAHMDLGLPKANSKCIAERFLFSS